MQSIVLLFLTASCLNLISSERQSAYRASSNVDAPQQQQQSHQQQQQQQQQQQFSSRLQSSEEQTANSGTLSNDSHYPLLESNRPRNGWYESSTSSDNSLNDSPVVSDNSHANKAHTFPEDGDRNKFKNYIEDFLHTPIKSNWLLPPPANTKVLFKNNYLPEYVPQWPHQGMNGTNQQRDDHHLDKREAIDQLTAGEEQLDPELLDDYYPILLDRRFQVFRSNDPYSSSPYLSSQEFKETFRRSDPYVVGKRARDLLDAVMLPFPAEKRVAPKFVGRRGPPYFVGKRENFDIPDGYLADVDLEVYESPLSGDKKAAPKFVGRRTAPYFVGKRRAPMFVGKRIPIFTLQNDELLSSEDKRSAPRFVGKRRAPFFVGKREYSYNLPDNWSELSSAGDLDWLLEKKGAPKFVGRRGAPYFVGKRGPPMFIGKRAVDSEPDIFTHEPSEVANILGRRGSPYFVGKRGAPRFVGKRWAEPDLQEQAHLSTQDKRRAPKFVGRRGSPFFVGKRGPKQLGGDGDTEVSNEEESQTLQEFRRAAPAFVGKRRAPFLVGKRGPPKFVGKRGPPKFVGKRLSEDEWPIQNTLMMEDKQSPVQFIERRASPYFVGRRGAPMFVGKRFSNSLYGNKDEQQMGNANSRVGVENSRNKVSNHISENNELAASNELNSVLRLQSPSNVDRLHAIEELKTRIQENTMQELNHLTQSRD